MRSHDARHLPVVPRSISSFLGHRGEAGCTDVEFDGAEVRTPTQEYGRQRLGEAQRHLQEVARSLASISKWIRDTGTKWKPP